MTDNLTLVRNYLDRWFALDVPGMAPFLSEDLRLWHNHIGTTFGKEESLAFIAASLTVISHVEYRNQRWTVAADDKVLLQHEMYIEMKDGGVIECLPNAIFYTVRDGLIVGIEEYVDSAAIETVRSFESQIEV